MAKLFVIAFALAVVAPLAYASVQKCECATFFIDDIKDEDKKLYSVPDTDVADCSNPKPCMESCESTFRKLTNNGDLKHITTTNATVGALACKMYKRDKNAGILGAFTRVCGGEWTSAVNMKQALSCKDGKIVV